MHNACRVRLRQTFGRLPEIFQQLWQRSLVANLLAERLAIHKFHRNEIHAIVLANLVDVRDVRMIERGCRLRLANEPLHTIALGSNFSGQNFECDVTMQPRVFGKINLAHSARA